MKPLARRLPHPVVAFCWLVIVGVLALVGADYAASNNRADAHSAQSSRAWPAGPIRYFDASDWAASVKVAADGWNRAELGVTFTETKDINDADVIITSSSASLAAHHHTFVGLVDHIGYRKGRRTYMTLQDATDGRVLSELIPEARITEIAVHEFGHVLGLAHRGGCRLMSPAADAAGCKRASAPALAYRCAPLPEDVAHAALLYRRRARQLNPFCQAGTGKPAGQAGKLTARPPQ